MLCGLRDTRKDFSPCLKELTDNLLKQDVSVRNNRMAYNKMVGKSKAKICDKSNTKIHGI